MIRGGYGIFFDIIPRTVTTGAAPFVVNEPNFTNPTAAPSVIFPRVFPATVGGPTQVGLPTATRPDLRTPYSMQYNVTVERQQWNTAFRVSYIGTNTLQGEWGYNINQPVADTRRFIDKPRRFPNYPAIKSLVYFDLDNPNYTVGGSTTPDSSPQSLDAFRRLCDWADAAGPHPTYASGSVRALG